MSMNVLILMHVEKTHFVKTLLEIIVVAVLKVLKEIRMKRYGGLLNMAGCKLSLITTFIYSNYNSVLISTSVIYATLVLKDLDV